jgi:hypothetical protein
VTRNWVLPAPLDFVSKCRCLKLEQREDCGIEGCFGSGEWVKRPRVMKRV